MPKINDYQSLSGELDAVVSRLQESDTNVDEAVKLYEQGLKLVAELETYLQQTESKIKRLKPASPQGSEE